MALVTILTPTYNRGTKLVELFESLQKQTSRNFEWLIVDDGSTDGTVENVECFVEQADFTVRYLYKENGGKHTALNLGVSKISTELTFIVDSDDMVLPEGIETIERYYNKYKDETGIGFFSFLRQSIQHGIMVKMPEDEYVGSYVEDRIKKNIPGDMAEVFYTRVLQEFPFPQFEGEKFLSEDVVWITIGLKYKTVFINQPIYLFDYLEDGLTCNDKRHKFASPLGSMLRGKMRMKKQCGIKERLRGAIIYNCYRRDVTQVIPPCVELESPVDRMLVFLLSPAGALFHKKWKGIANG